jgi:sulfur carrier protein ThiS
VKEGQVVEAADTWYGLPATLTVTMYDSDAVPRLSYEDKALELSLVGKNTYEAKIYPSKIGIEHVSGYPIAVNYGMEYRDVGINEELSALVTKTDGEVYSESEAKAFLLKAARNSYRSQLTQVSQKRYFILAALLLFLLEVCFRRGREIIEARREKE